MRHGFSGTGNLVVRRGDFDRIGPFEGIHVAEDMDWGRRARAGGFQFRYVADMIVYHPARGALRDLFVKLDRHTQHYVNMARQKPYWQVRWVTRALAVLISPAVAIVNVVTTDRIQGISARLKAASVLVAVRSYRAWKMLSLMHSSKEVVWNRNAGNVPDE